MKELLKLISDGKFDEARTIISPALTANPLNGDMWFALGCIQDMQQDIPYAIQSYKRATELSPDNDKAWFNYARLIKQSPLPENQLEVRKAYKEVLRITPDANVQKTIYIGIPHYGSSAPAFEESLHALRSYIKPEHNINLLIRRCEGSRITSNRNQLVKDAIHNQATHILFIDSDMDFPADSLIRMLDHNKDIVCATTCKRGDMEGKPIGQIAQEEGKSEDTRIVRTDGTLYEMQLVGACFMLINLDVFKKIRLPAFYEPPYYEGEDAYGEDITFCKLVKNAGLKIWCDMTLSFQLGHHGSYRYHIKHKESCV